MKKLFGKKQKKYEDLYRQGREVGGGAFALVYECEYIESGKKRAAKIIDKRSVKKEEFKNLRREIDILKKDGDKLILVMDLADGGELFQKIQNGEIMAEDEVRDIIRQVVSACEYLHSNRIAHRDLKPENILLTSDGIVKLADFGLSKMIDDGEQLKTTVGTLDYMAPEVVLEDQYTYAVDLWSTGVVAYVLLSGKLPFYSKKPNQVFQKIASCEYTFEHQIFDSISIECKDFISKLIVKEDKARLTATAALQHPWLAGTKLDKTATSHVKEEKKKERRASLRSALQPITDEEGGGGGGGGAATSPSPSRSLNTSGGSSKGKLAVPGASDVRKSPLRQLAASPAAAASPLARRRNLKPSINDVADSSSEESNS